MSTSLRRETADDAAPSRALADSVRSALERGGLVALPTETVYGVAARANDRAALERLRALKSRPGERGFTWHVGSADVIERFPEVRAIAGRLAARYWPGPLTLVLPGVPSGLEDVAVDGWTGVRLPAQRATAGILAKIEFPVVMTSANAHGASPLLTASDVARELGDGLEIVVDGGPSRLGEPSSVLRLGRGRFDLLRPGLFTIEQLRAAAGLRIAFACTGNTCRSPMAEAIAKGVLAKRLGAKIDAIGDFGFTVRSFGMSATPGDVAAPHAREIVREQGLDLESHSARRATIEDVLAKDRVYAMTRGHVDALKRMLPPDRAAHVVLLDPEGDDVADPVGGTLVDYRIAADAIRTAIESRAADWV